MLLKNQICILFLHYLNDDVTINHYELLKKYNPTKNIYPIGFENHNLIDGSHVVRKSELYPKNDIINKNCKKEYWTEADLLIYDFYLKYPNLPTYLVMEWDTYCNCS
jgi:predicted small secreted protein